MRLLIFLLLVGCATTPSNETNYPKSKYKAGDCVALVVCSDCIDGYTGRVCSKPQCTVTGLEMIIEQADTIGYTAHYRVSGYEEVKYDMSKNHVESEYTRVNCDGKYP